MLVSRFVPDARCQYLVLLAWVKGRLQVLVVWSTLVAANRVPYAAAPNASGRYCDVIRGIG